MTCLIIGLRGGEMSPIGHTLAGITIYLAYSAVKKKRPRAAMLVPVILLSNLPDLDLVPAFWKGFPVANSYHQGFTHTFVFCFLVSLIAGAVHWVMAGQWNRNILAAAFFLPALHICADAVTLSDPFYGVMLLYPFSLEPYLFPPVFLSITRDSWSNLFSLSNFKTTIHEIFVFLPFISWLLYLTFNRMVPARSKVRHHE